MQVDFFHSHFLELEQPNIGSASSFQRPSRQHRFLAALALLGLVVGCDARNRYPETHWTVVEIHPGETGEYLATSSPGAPLGYSISYLECRSGKRRICLLTDGDSGPVGLDIGDRFVFARQLTNVPQEKMAYGMSVYRASINDIRRL